MKAKFILTAALLLTFSFSALNLFSQSPPPPPPGAPIDGGIMFLVVGIALYGYKKIKEGKELVAE